MRKGKEEDTWLRRSEISGAIFTNRHIMASKISIISSALQYQFIGLKRTISYESKQPQEEK